MPVTSAQIDAHQSVDGDCTRRAAQIPPARSNRAEARMKTMTTTATTIGPRGVSAMQALLADAIRAWPAVKPSAPWAPLFTNAERQRVLTAASA